MTQLKGGEFQGSAQEAPKSEKKGGKGGGGYNELHVLTLWRHLLRGRLPWNSPPLSWVMFKNNKETGCEKEGTATANQSNRQPVRNGGFH